LLYEGTCEISKSLKSNGVENFNGRECTICLVSSGSLIGEEILAEENSEYEYTVKVVTSKCKALAIDKEIFKTRFPELVNNGVKKFFKVKHSQNLAILARKQENLKNLMPIIDFAKPAKLIDAKINGLALPI
jgi:hypothetical protein